MAKFDPFFSLDCARVEGVGAQSKERKGSNFAIWQPCSFSPVDALDVEAALLDLGDALADDGRDLHARLEEVLAQVHAERRHLARQPLVAALQRQHLLARIKEDTC